MNHAVNYERSLSLGAFIALASLAAIGLFIYYSIEWVNATTQTKDQEEFLRAGYAYQGGVLALLTLVVFFNGYFLVKLK